MRTSGYVVALGGFALLMAGGLGLGLWLNAGVARMEPGALELDVGPELTAVIVGNSGDDTPDARQVREAAAAYCAEAGCDLVVLLGDTVLPAGPDAPDDPRLDARIGAWAAIAPTVVVPGDRDVGPIGDGRGFGRLVSWARDNPDVLAPSATFDADAGPALLIGLDSNELLGGGAGADAQRAWLDQVLAANARPWPVALVHDVDAAEVAAVCGRARVALHAGPGRSWVERCGTTFVASGTGGETPSGEPAPQGSLHHTPAAGFVVMVAQPDRLEFRFIGADRRETFRAVKVASGAVELVDGTVLRQP